jgi:hypothetical protein
MLGFERRKDFSDLYNYGLNGLEGLSDYQISKSDRLRKHGISMRVITGKTCPRMMKQQK